MANLIKKKLTFWIFDISKYSHFSKSILNFQLKKILMFNKSYHEDSSHTCNSYTAVVGIAVVTTPRPPTGRSSGAVRGSA